MARTSNIYVRVEPDIKQEAESVLKELGIPMSNAVTMFLRQVILQNGIPFDVKLPNKKPIDFASLTKEEFNEAISEGIRDFENGNLYTAKQIKEEMTKVFRNDI